MHRVPLQIHFQHRSEHQSSVTSPCHRSSQTFRASQHKMKPYFDANISPLPFPRVILSYVLYFKKIKGLDFKHFEVMKKTCLDLDWSHATKRPPPTLVLLAFEDLAVAPAEAQHQNQATSSPFISMHSIVMLTTSCAELFANLFQLLDISNFSNCSCQRTESICSCSIKTMTLCSTV